MKFKKYNDLIVGISMLAFGLFYLIMTTQIQRKGKMIDATFFPYILSTIMLIVGTLQTIKGVLASKKYDVSSYVEPKANEIGDMKTVLITVGLIIAYVALLKPLGFVLSSSLYLFVQIIVMVPNRIKKNFVLYAVIAVATSALIYVSFRFGLDLMLPAGLLG
ncbi:MAG: tripartite tricarboxylate transporter TctB family protein [Youngiibacter sp.]|nr:tripartite tricarboxylate transporter TctB family protein [Youngiibacter sp.]